MAAAGRHPGALRRLPPDGAAQRPGRLGRLRLRPQPRALVLGLKLYLLACPDGMPVAWCLANPKLGERDVAEVLLDRAARQRVLRPGVVVLADKGLAGRAFGATVAEFGAVLVRPDRTNEPARFGSLGGVRQRIEATIDALKDQLSLEQHGAHTVQGVWIRVAQRLLASAASVWFNWQLNAAVKRSIVAYDQRHHSPTDTSDLVVALAGAQQLSRTEPTTMAAAAGFVCPGQDLTRRVATVDAIGAIKATIRPSFLKEHL